MYETIFFPNGQAVPAVGSIICVNNISTRKHTQYQVIKTKSHPTKNGINVVVLPVGK